VETKLIRINKRAWDIIRLEALRESFERHGAISMGTIIAKYAEKLNRKHKYILPKQDLKS
jgi:hypothetical protein